MSYQSVMPRFVNRLFLSKGLLVFAMLVMASSCKRTKDSFTSRTYHEMTSRFNPLFNGTEAFKAGKLKVEQAWKEDFNNVLPVYKWPNEEASGTIAPDMDRAMEKAVKVITGHSMVIQNDQKNDYIDDSYLLIGDARFYKGEHFSALETFNYIQTNYSEGDLVYISKLRAAQCKIQIGNPAGAKTDLEYLYNDPELPKDMKPDVLASMGQMNIGLEDWSAVAANLGEASELAKRKEQRVRYMFIRGQALEKAGDPYEASESFYRVVKMRPEYEFYFHSQLNRARNYDVYANDPEPLYEGLEKMIKDEKNIENRDQIFYVMAEVALKEELYEKAENFLRSSIRASVSNQSQKALSYLKIGEINFEFKAYPMAQAYYDSAASILPADHPRYDEVVKRADVLGRMVDDLNTIQLQDSLQNLSSMSEARQKEIAEIIIEDLIAREEEEARAQELAELNQELADAGAGMPTGPVAGGPNVGKWYFYNPNLVTNGRSTFKRLWGNRENNDNWAQKSRARSSFGQTEEQEIAEGDSTSTEESAPVSTDPYEVETYLARIPKSKEDFEKSDELIREAFIDLGLVYKDGLDNLPQSIVTYEELLKRYDEFDEKPRVLYTLFLLHREAGNDAESDKYKQQLITDYAGTEFAILAANDGVPVAEEEDRPCLVEYERAYRFYKDKRYSEAERIISQNQTSCAEDILAPHYQMLKALCSGGRSRKEQMITELQECYGSYPNSEVGVQAKEILEQLGASTGEETTASEGEGSNEGNEQVVEEGPYKKNAKMEHRYLMLIEGKVNINDVQIAFTDHNKEFHRFQKLGQQILPLNQEYIAMVVTGLKNEAAAKAYKKALLSDPRMAQMVGGIRYTDYIITKENFVYFFKNKDIEGYKKFYNKNYKDKK